jgi:hypothetical protein
VRKKDTGKLYAMKVMSKDHIVRGDKVDQVMNERKILEEV